MQIENSLKKHNSNKVWLYGLHASLSALSNENRKIHRILALKKYYDNILDILSQRNLSKNLIHLCDRAALEKVLPLDAIHQGIAIEVDYLETENLNVFTANLKEHQYSCVLLLDQVNDSRNIGSIIRSAVAFDVAAIVFTKANFPKENGAMVKAAAGGFEKIKLIEVANLSNSIMHLKKEGFWIIGLDAHTDSSIHQLDFFPKIALILGSEGDGMRELTKKSCDFLAKIPQSPNMESLNISNAAAIALYEIYKKSL
ncbi:MAG: 23S rRNA (guanosine(2251)-2'-O)-methyltransferase RlmB [Alphaproteobacteria bacterium]|nr:23S rRNA (guanosine(2251)-2'-O)-methyltransferase RlmB [Alphaproteobacteria bacterium]